MLFTFLKRRFHRSIPAAVILASQVGLFFAVSAHAEARYRVIEVLSGDTLRVEDSRTVFTVRLVGIDAPDNKPDDSSPGQPFNEEARRYLSQLVFQKTVDVFSFGYDIESNVLGLVRVDGNDIGIEMVRAGLAEIDSVKAPPGFDLTPLLAAEKDARRDGRGIWSLGTEYVSPRKWRKLQGASLPLAGAPEPKGIIRQQTAGKESGESNADTRLRDERKTIVHGIDVEIGDSGEKVRVSLDGFSVPRAFDIDGKEPRVVIDIFNVADWQGRDRIPVNGRLIRQVRTYLHKNSGKLRIVLDLTLDPSKDHLIDQYYDAKKNTYWLEIRK